MGLPMGKLVNCWRSGISNCPSDQGALC